MSAIRIPRLGENKEVQAKVTFPKRLHDLLIKYAEAYEAAYGEKVQPEKLVPVIVEDYLRKDHGFKKYLSKNTQKDDTQSPVEKKETKQKPLAA